MNIYLYYHAKVICLHLKNQTTHNQEVKDLDTLSDKNLKQVFGTFIQQNDKQVLEFQTSDFEKAIEQFRAIFYFIEAAGGLITQNNKHLFIYRHRRWDLPKGKLDKGESPEAAAIRECEEECGITGLSITGLILNTYHIYDYKGSYALKKTWWYAMNSTHSGKLVPQAEEDIERVEWFGREDIENTVMQNTYALIKDILKRQQLV